MTRYVLQRLAAMIISLLCIITITFLVMHAIPGGPFTREKPLPEAIVRALNAKYHLDDPLYKQYFDYLGGLLKGDMGPSFQFANRTVNEMIVSSFPITAKLGLTTVLLTLLLGVPLGIWAALRQAKVTDYAILFASTLGVTIPSFVMAIILMYVFSVQLGWFPAISSDLEQLRTMALPVLALMGYSLSFIVRLTRSSMLDVINQDYIRTARAKGISELKVIFKHALKNAILPVVTYVGPMIASLLTGSFVIERIFTIPGTGGFFVKAIGNRDYTMIMGATIFYAALLAVMNFIVDMIYGVIDPRIKLAAPKGEA